MSMREQSGRLRRYWYAATTSAELGNKPLQRIVLETPIALWRDRSGKPVALLDRCLHRNAPLSEGVLVDGALACPYHGWTYDTGGRCIAIPSQPGRPVDGLALESFPVTETGGLVWVWMGGPAAPDKQPFPMPYWGERGWVTYYMVTPFQNDVTSLVENFMDVPHTIFVHRGWFRSEARKPVRTLVERTEDSVLVTYDQPKDTIGFTGRFINPGGHAMVHTDKFYLPNVTRVDYDFGGQTGFVITSTCTPRGPFDTLVFTLISYKLGSRVLNRLGKLVLPSYTRRVIGQDVDIMAVHGRNVQAFRGERKYHNTDADLHHLYIESLREWAELEEGPPLPPKRQEITFSV